MSAHVLVVEDDPDVRETTALLLTQAGFHVRTAVDGIDGLSVAAVWDPDVAVVDVNMPGRDGLSLTRHLRQHGICPVIVLTARDRREDELAGFDAGADDYITKPFDGAVLVARVQAVLRRAGDGAQHEEESALTPVPGLQLEPQLLGATWRGVHARLTQVEYTLLALLAENPGMVLDRRRILTSVWGESGQGDGHVVDVNVARVRRKLGRDVIRTEHGLGYRVGAP
ncbi:response regulator transcription factor [Cellulomonas sp. NPDC089187]|uniref:response regulator transcription factor n=1 Tax=Cellulomonas sp. NPDC089187 TaxID=3154970 RepID=UPI0034396D5E